MTKILPSCLPQLYLLNMPNAGKLSKTRLWLLVGWQEFLLCSGMCHTWPFLLHIITYILSVSREESEKVSELKSVLGSSKLPYGTLASGTEGIRDAINGFDDACVIFSTYPSLTPKISLAVASRTLRMNTFLRISLTLIQKKAKPF